MLFLMAAVFVGFYLFQERPPKAIANLETTIKLKPSSKQTNKPDLTSKSQSKPSSNTRQFPKRALLDTIASKPRAPDFSLLDEDGKIHRLSDYKGKPLILNFWATWCPPCREELPSMNRAWKKIKDEGIEMIAVNVGEDEDTVFAFTAEYPIDFQVLFDESGEIIKKWSVRGLPTTFILDIRGHIVYRATGGREWDAEELLDEVRKLKMSNIDF